MHNTSTKKSAKSSSPGPKAAPSAMTLAIIRQFARAYTPIPAVASALSGVVAN